MLYICGALCAGLIIPLQTGVNTRLKNWLGSPIYASFVSFIFATLTLFLLMGVTGAYGIGKNLFDIPLWLWLGGFFGTVVITGNIFLLPRLGGVQTVVLPAAGQVIMGLLIDTFGWFEVNAVWVTWMRIAGALLVIVGIFLTTAVSAEGVGVQKRGFRIWIWRAFSVLLGAGTSCQTAVNGRFGITLGSSIEASFLSCVIGTLLLAVFSFVLAVIKRKEVYQRPVKGVWWMWCGGILGGTMILLNATLAPLMGTGSEVVFALAGSLAFGVIIDQFGLFGVKKKPLTCVRAAGLAILLFGACLVKVG